MSRAFNVYQTLRLLVPSSLSLSLPFSTFGTSKICVFTNRKFLPSHNCKTCVPIFLQLSMVPSIIYDLVLLYNFIWISPIFVIYTTTRTLDCEATFSPRFNVHRYLRTEERLLATMLDYVEARSDKVKGSSKSIPL